MSPRLKAGGVVGLALLMLACSEAREIDRIAESDFERGPFSVCGNGELERGEQCDDGNTTTESCGYGDPECVVCDKDCNTHQEGGRYCGDGEVDVEEGEVCDEGDLNSNTCAYGITVCSVCNENCQTVVGATTYCGDGLRDSVNGEVCDDGFLDSCGTCNEDCSGAGVNSVCGDGVKCFENESCDDGNAVDGDGCDSSCQITGCGSGVVTEGEVCDDGNQEDWDACSADCQKDTSVPRFQMCENDGTYQGNCEGYAHCVPWEGAHYCLKPCENAEDTTTCGAGACSELQIGSTNASYYCLRRTALRDQFCRDNLQVCAPGEGSCMPTEYSTADGPGAFRCKVLCDGTQLGERGGCPQGELCAKNSAGYVDLMPGEGGNRVSCVGDIPLECGEEFECVSFASGASFCAKWVGWCGELTPLCGQFDYAGIVECVENASCDDRKDHQICGVTGGIGEPANTNCLTFGLGSVCVGICESGDATLDCGEGYVCRAPPPGQQVYFELQAEGTVPCTSSFDCAEGYQCNSFNVGLRCGRPLDLCFYEGGEFDSCEMFEGGGDSCAAGLACLGLNGNPPLCLKSCGADDGLDCADGECMDVVIAAGDPRRLCLPRVAERDGYCKTNLKACRDFTECVPTLVDSGDGEPYEFRCKEVCDVADIGARGSCGPGERCFPPTVEAEGAPRFGWCGEGVGLCLQTDTAGLAQCQYNQRCDERVGHHFCEAPPGFPADAVACESVGGGDVCVGFCGGDGAPFECGPWARCRVPHFSQAVRSEEQPGSVAPCERSDECDEAQGYSCYPVSGESRCARPLAICVHEEPMCGDWFVEGGEACDDGNRGDGDGCDNNCTLTGCGNGVTTPGEECDLGGDVPWCDGDCTYALCGDGYLNTSLGEVCDDAGFSVTCNNDCTASACGDGITNVLAGERCDGPSPCAAGCDSVLWAEDTSFHSVGLTGWDFREESLAGRDFSGAYLDGVLFDRANLRGADFSNAAMTGVSWTHAYYDSTTRWPGEFAPELVAALYHIGPGSTLRGADLRGAELSEGDLGGADLSGADLRDASLAGTNLRRTLLLGVNLGGVTWTHGYWDSDTKWPDGIDPGGLAGLYFIGENSDLTGASLNGAILGGATLSLATLSGATLIGANLSGAVLSGATLSSAILSGATLSGATLSGANLSSADLSGADLSGARLTGADLTNAILSGVIADGGDWTGVICPDGAINVGAADRCGS